MRGTSARAADRAEPPGRGAGDAATLALWATACVLAALRALLGFLPTMHLWSLNLGRFLAPPAAWLPWAYRATLATIEARRAA